MLALSHVVLHLTLACKSTAKLSAEAAVPIHVVLAYPVRAPEMDQTFKVQRDSDNVAIVEFDAPQGVYRLFADIGGKRRCGGVDYLVVLPDHDRSFALTLTDRPVPPITPALVAGSAEMIAHPTVVLFPKNTACNKSVGDPLSEPVDNEISPGAYYAAVNSAIGIHERGSRIIAVRLTDSSGGFHYIRVRIDFPNYTNGWPTFTHFNVSTDLIEYAADKPEDTLLCPPMYRTSVGGPG
ncbi:MAG TPA: hypothetical protein VIG32_11690 [Candidatus Baltobacteraceae bacterium]|jgi:hypothetical protein